MPVPRTLIVLAGALALASACASEDDDPVALAAEASPAAVARGGYARLHLVATFRDGRTKEISSGASWRAEPSGVVTFGNGWLRGVTAGTVTVVATYRGLEASASVRVRAERLVFVTSKQGSGDLSTWPDAGGLAGLVGADGVCAALAVRGGLPGRYVAWLSDDETDAYCRVHGSWGTRADRCGRVALPSTAGPWIRPDGRPFADGVAALAAGAVLYPADLDETGQRRPATLEDFTRPSSIVFTATGPDGELFVEGVSGNCANWTSDVPGQSVWAGDAGSGAGAWTRFSPVPCDAPEFSLLCLEVGEGAGAPLEPFEEPGKRVFVTGVGGTGALSSWPEASGASGLAAADAICSARATAASIPGTFLAWVSDGTLSAATRVLHGPGPWVRLDGVVVGTDAEIRGDRLRAPIGVDESGVPSSSAVWTGAVSRLEGTAFTCEGWTSGAFEVGGTIGVASASGPLWSSWYSVPCLSQFALYCFEQ